MLKCVIILFRKTNNIKTIRFKNFARSLTSDRVTVLTEDTLTGRILHYLSSTNKIKDHLVLLKDNAVVADSNINQIIKNLNSFDRSVIKNQYDFKTLVNAFDNECCRKFRKLNVKETFNLLHTFMEVVPNNITNYRYFGLAITHLIKNSHTLSFKDIVQLIFFVGLLKKSPQSQAMMRKCLKLLDDDAIDHLTKEELCIVCNSSFKTSTKMQNKYFLEKIRNFICDNLNLLKDPQIFVTFVKTIRHNRGQEDDFLETISCAVIFNKTYYCYSFPAVGHLLALYSDHLYYDEKILRLFANQGIEQLKGCEYTSKYEYFEEQPRSKDIKRFLWALSNLNFKLSRNDIERVIMPQIIVRVDNGEFLDDPSILVEIILYLWIMQYKAHNLIDMALTNNSVTIIRGEKSLAKERLNLLLTCMYFEDRKLFDSIKLRHERGNEYNMNIQLQKRPLLNRVFDNLKNVYGNSIDRFQFVCQVPYVNIIGIRGFRNKVYKAVNIEVLDEYTCMKNSDHLPTGLMDLKLRILDKCDEGLIVIIKEDIEEFSDIELQEFLQEELSFVC
ncbi:uncharacterized protein LOC132708060 [Cylas formicarius]|uniref:uncharacterized protein LOC132708060 n=1 Tax=Cylas formicarius TaxID=197179 RepID=UPI0029588FAF|nr:uncharacterized protein LOC132708060 [Cylas formicarius]